MSNSLVKTLSRCLAEALFQLEAAENQQVNSDFALALMEAIGAELQQLEGRDAAELVTAIREVAGTETDEERKQYFESFPEYFGLV